MEKRISFREKDNKLGDIEKYRLIEDCKRVRINKTLKHNDRESLKFKTEV